MRTPFTWNADRIAPNKIEFGVKWRNYLAAEWTPIDLTPRQVSGEWVFDRAPYALTLPALSTGWLTFESTNRYDIHTKRVMPDAKVGVQKRYTGAVAVTGVPDAGGLRFAGAFPSLNADRLVQPHEQKVRDLIVFTSEPPGRGDVEVPIEIDFGGLPMLESAGHGKMPAEADFRSDKDVLNGLSFTTGSFRGVKIKQPFAWDSGRKRAAIKLVGRVVGTRFVGSKVIPRSVFAGAVFPVYADTTTTFYPDPNTETTSVDGYAIRSGVTESWATIRAGNGTSAADQFEDGTLVARKDGTGLLWTQLVRTLLVFDTSAIDDTETVTAAVLSVKAGDVWDNGSQSISVSPGTTASNTAIAASDFQSNTSATVYSSVAVSAISVNTYADFTLDAAGRASVSKTGVTKFCLKLSGDASGTEPAGVAASVRVGLDNVRMADTALTTSDPKLVVTHEAVPFTGTAALTASNATLSATGTFTKPTYTATAALTASNATLSASAGFTPTTYKNMLLMGVG